MRFTRRSDRSDPARRRLGSSVERLEGRELLSTTAVSAVGPFSPWLPQELHILNPISHKPDLVSLQQIQHLNNTQSQFLNNQGKIVSGKDRQGNEWTITVHGPGTVEVTDITPNDGILADDINTIRLLNTDPNRTYVTGTVVSSARLSTSGPFVAQSDGTTLFQKLIDYNGVKSIQLNGFSLTQTVLPPQGQTPNYADTGIFLYGGVGTLSFTNVLASYDAANGPIHPIPIQIGDASTPIKVAPKISLFSIYNTVFNSKATTNNPIVGPQTTPSVIFEVNGQIKSLNLVSVTQHPAFDPNAVVDVQQVGFNPTTNLGVETQRSQYLTTTVTNPDGTTSTVTTTVPAPNEFTPIFTTDPKNQVNPNVPFPLEPERLGTTATELQRTNNRTLSPIEGAGAKLNFTTVDTTGRTAIRAIGIGHLHVKGAAVNLTASRGVVPFQSGFSGLDHLGSAKFGGNADAVGLDVNGPIHGLAFRRGLGNPTGTNLGASTIGMAGSGTTIGATVPTSTNVDATTFGTPSNTFGYPSHGLLGGLVTATRIGHVNAGPANQHLQVPSNPDYVQLYRQGNTAFIARPGNALTSAAIVSSGSIGKTHVKGDLVNSEIKSGFHYQSFAAGLEGTRARSQTGPYVQKGSQTDSVVSATYRQFNHRYQTTADVVGPGKITGHIGGALYATGGATSLGNISYNNMGVGFFARRKLGYLPPAQSPTRVHGILIR